MNSVFQLFPNSPYITTKDVRTALRKTRRMRPQQRLKYFQERGMHYSRCVKYINTVENLDKVFDEVSMPHVVIEEYSDQSIQTTIREIDQFIEKLIKELEQ